MLRDFIAIDFETAILYLIISSTLLPLPADMTYRITTMHWLTQKPVPPSRYMYYKYVSVRKIRRTRIFPWQPPQTRMTP